MSVNIPQPLHLTSQIVTKWDYYVIKYIALNMKSPSHRATLGYTPTQTGTESHIEVA